MNHLVRNSILAKAQFDKIAKNDTKLLKRHKIAQ